MIGEDLGDQKCWLSQRQGPRFLAKKKGKDGDLDMGFMAFMWFIADLMGFIADLIINMNEDFMEFIADLMYDINWHKPYLMESCHPQTRGKIVT